MLSPRTEDWAQATAPGSQVAADRPHSDNPIHYD